MADVFFYDALTTGDADGTTWEDAYQDLQTAIDALASGDVLRCKGGTITLTARIDFDNSNDNEIVGGYDTSLTGTTVPTTRDLPADITILDGVDTYRCMYVTQQHTIDGFKCINGYSSSIGGSYIYVTSGTVTLRNCIFTDNNAANGGAFYKLGAGTLVAEDCTFDDNSATSDAGAFVISACTANISDCTFDGNHSNSGKAACSVTSAGTLNFTDCKFTDNTTGGYYGGCIGSGSSTSAINCVRVRIDGTVNSSAYGGAAQFSNASSSWINCILSNNTCNYGAGVYISGGTHSFTNCIIADNDADNDAAAIRNTGSATTTLENCVVWGNRVGAAINNFANAATLTVTYSDVEQSSGTYTGTGNVNDDPNFVGTGDNPYSFSTTSECIDSGNAGATDYPSTDILGNSRVDVTTVTNTGAGTPDYSDMGAYEYQPPVTDVDVYGAILLGY